MRASGSNVEAKGNKEPEGRRASEGLRTYNTLISIKVLEVLRSQATSFLK